MESQGQPLKCSISSCPTPSSQAGSSSVLLYLFALHDYDQSGQLDGLELLSMLTAALAPGAANSPTTNLVSSAGWRSPHKGDPALWGFGLSHHNSFGLTHPILELAPIPTCVPDPTSLRTATLCILGHICG
ncbi:cell growth regulator with EF hand domain protein 1 isoform X3 [Hylobates moloch]|uniref:cell growth regulator with EF hand domain protein 1 isoform X3 n=1 Tax=Hylobates moloch TaxID=81572 RepID=UPI0013636082|nr:cell growth regulator with EF hand domain protein 1 isoform X3 [Hylobates moloch]